MKIKFEKEVKSCAECPFRYYHQEMGGPSGYMCAMRDHLGELYSFAEEENGINKNCPFLEKN